MGSELVMVDEFPFPTEITTTKPLPIIGSGNHLFILNFSCFVINSSLELDAIVCELVRV